MNLLTSLSPRILLAVFLLAGCGRFDYESHPSVEADAALPEDASADAGTPDASSRDAAADLGEITPDLGADLGADSGLVVEPSVLVDPTTGLTTTESGGTATFAVHLATPPTANVFLLLESEDPDEVSVAPLTLAFTNVNWNSPQIVTLTGVDDGTQDGNQAFTVSIGAPTSADAAYASLSAQNVTGTNLDNESPGIIVSPTSGLTTTEAGGTATFQVSLQSEPTADVEIPIASGALDEGSVSPASVTFTTSNWASPQIVTVTGVDDALLDGSQSFVVHVGPSTSTQIEYAGLSGSDVTVTNEDDETPHLVVAPLSGLVTTEGGGTASFTVALGAEPDASVSISVSSTRSAEGTVSPATLTFTTANWMIPQTVTAMGIDDALLDGNQPYEAVVHVSGGDPAYAATTDKHVSITNVDDETAGITVSPTAGLVTSELGASATFTIVLNASTSADVTIALSSDNPLEGTVSPASVTFNAANWDTPQTVTVTGVDDLIADGARAYTILTAAASSADTNYAGLNASDVSVTNLDDDVPGVTVMPVSGLATTEAGGTAMFSVVLNVAPVSDVVIALASSDSSEGTVAPATLTFTAGNWSTPQTVTATGVDDFAIDGDVSYAIVTSSTMSASAAYSGIPVSDVSVVNTDNDVAGIVVAPTSGLTTTEAGGSATFTVVLSTQPASDVVISLSSSDATEGSVAPASVTFNGGNWNAPQTVTVTGVDDPIDDGDVAYTIVTSAASSADLNYNGLGVADVSATNTDDDVNGVTVTPTSGLATTELGGTATFTMVLSALPAADVSVALSSNNLTEGTVSPASVTFTTSNWSTPQTVTITGVNDSRYDGYVAYTIVTGATTSTDALYNGLAVADVSVTNQNVITYVKASNTSANDQFGSALAMSSDGSTFVVGSYYEDSNATGIGGDGSNNSSTDSGAVYVYVRSGATWVQQAYIKASNTDADDRFGSSVALSADGNVLAVGALQEASNATGIDGNQANNGTLQAGAVYLFRRTGSTWVQESYVKASNTDLGDTFGTSVALSSDGTTLAVGAGLEDSNATGIGGNQANNSAMYAGAVYVFTRSGMVWSQQAYVKASNTNAMDYFGSNVALSADGSTLAVGAYGEASNATGVGGNQANNSTLLAGAVYVFTRAGVVWSQQAYVKASDVVSVNFFGNVCLSNDGDTMLVGSNTAAYVYNRSGGVWSFESRLPGIRSVALSADGNTLVGGSYSDNSNATGIGGDRTNSLASQSGAAFVYTRSMGTWTEAAYVKATNTNANDYFGWKVALSGDGHTLVAAAIQEQSNATGIDGNQSNNSFANAGAVYVVQ